MSPFQSHQTRRFGLNPITVMSGPPVTSLTVSPSSNGGVLLMVSMIGLKLRRIGWTVSLYVNRVQLPRQLLPRQSPADDPRQNVKEPAPVVP